MDEVIRRIFLFELTPLFELPPAFELPSAFELPPFFELTPALAGGREEKKGCYLSALAKLFLIYNMIIIYIHLAKANNMI